MSRQSLLDLAKEVFGNDLISMDKFVKRYLKDYEMYEGVYQMKINTKADLEKELNKLL